MLKTGVRRKALKTVLHPHCADGQEDGSEGDGERPVPPWAAELKKKNRPLVVGMGVGARESNGKVSVTPFKSNSDKNNSPVVNAGLWTLALLCVLHSVCVCVYVFGRGGGGYVVGFFLYDLLLFCLDGDRWV